MLRLGLWVTIAAVFWCAGGAFAAEPAGIRAAIRLPSMQLQAGIGYSPKAGLVEVDESGPPEAAIAKIRAALKGDASDAARYRTLGSIYAGQGLKTESQQAYSRAIEAYDAALKNSPDDGALLAGKGDSMAGRGDLAAAEAFLKAEARRVPGAWQVRTALGRVLRHRAFWAFWPEKDLQSRDLLVLMNQQGADFPVLAAVRLKAQFPTTTQLRAAEELLRESGAAFEAAIQAAPELPEPYAERMAHRFAAAPLGVMTAQLKKLDSKASIVEIEEALRGLQSSSQAAMLDADTLADARKVAELRKNDPQAWGLAAGMGRLITAFLTEAGKEATPAVRQSLFAPFKALDGLAEKARAELERMSKSPSPQEAAAALEALGLIHYQEGDAPAADAVLRRAVGLDPLRSQAWELLAGLLLSRGQFGEVATLYEGLLKHRDSTKTRLVLAKVYERLDQADKVETHLNAALALDGEDISTRTYSAAYVLRKRGLDGLSVAEQHLSAAEKALERKPGKFEELNLKYVRAAILALQSKPDAARKLLAEVLKEDEKHSGAVALNAALK